MTKQTRTAALLYWLLVVAGLAGMTFIRVQGEVPAWSEVRNEILPVWIGTLGGVAVGQLLSWLRVRPWVPLALGFVSLWFTPFLYYAAYFFFRDQIGDALTPTILAFLPAAASGFLALSERGVLAAFWYPTVLWMVLILDSRAARAADVRAGLPFALALTALFVAFLRARETRRTAIWQRHGEPRIAPVMSRTVLRSAPGRAAAGHAWTTLVGAAALVLAAWIAPHLWRKDTHATQASLGASSPDAPQLDDAGRPCCPASRFDDEPRRRIREYLPLRSSRDGRKREADLAQCTRCSEYANQTTSTDEPRASIGDTSTPPDLSGAGAVSGRGSSTPVAAAPAQRAPITNTPAAPPRAPRPDLATPSAPPTDHVAVAPPPKPSYPSVRYEEPGRVEGAPITLTVAEPAARPIDPSSPWRFTLALVAASLISHIAVRMLRRSLTLRHLARPFWRETLDQRISNHWQRMLVGLRDAGICPTTDEQPLAFATRIGIDGMATCATILERVRHGVRVEDADVATMDAASTAVYGAARRRAGRGGRAWAWLRWPLA
jgi:hypothetical protein